jgi:ABC-type multidrug transport system ATPase subunit
MLELIGVSRRVPHKRDALTVLHEVSFGVPAGHLMTVIGATGSGKTSLIRLLAGFEKAAQGTLLFHGEDCGKRPPHPNQIGYVPAADDVLDEALTVRESLMSALVLRVAGLSRDERIAKASHLLVAVGLETLAGDRVASLGLPQRRRLKLALALVSDPALVLCDEFTDGMDARSERELAALLKCVASDHPARVVIHATQTVGNLAAYDTVVILHEGHVCFHGPSRAVTHYFSIAAMDELYPRLAKRPAERWGDSWSRHRDSYYDAFQLGGLGEPAATSQEIEAAAAPPSKKTGYVDIRPVPEGRKPPPPLPSALAQAGHLIQRRWTLLGRTRAQWLRHLSVLLLAPLATILLVLPNRGFLARLAGQTPPQEVLWPAAYTCMMALWLQVLLALMMGVRAGAREIGIERPLYERERAGGLRPGAYLLSKLGFVLPLVLAQAFALGLLPDLLTGGLPGDALPRLPLLALTGVAFACLCLGISACSANAERAHSRSWMLFFYNLILGGALLGFPRALGNVIHPFITAYYGWSGSIETLANTVVFVPITQLVRTWFATPGQAFLALGIHALIGILTAWFGLRQRR